MNFNNHSKLEGQHAFLGASKYHWINYDDEKLAQSYTNFLAAQKGTNAAMIAMSVSVLILASALKKLSDLQWDELARGLTGVAGLTAIVVVAAKAMSSNSQKVMKGATSLVIFAAAIKILASACKDLSVLDWDELGRGLTGVGVLMGEVALFLKVAKFQGKAISTATGIVILAAAMKILASACKDFGNLDWEQLKKGLVSIGVLLGEIAAFTNLTGKASHERLW